MDAPITISPTPQTLIRLSRKRKATEAASAIKTAYINHPIAQKIEQTAVPVLSKKREAPEVDELNAKRKTGRRPNKLVIPTAEQLGKFDENDYIQIKDGKVYIAISTKKIC